MYWVASKNVNAPVHLRKAVPPITRAPWRIADRFAPPPIIRGRDSVAGQKDSVTMRSLERAIDVLEVLEDAGRPLRLVEVAERSGLHVATTQRILSVLENRGRVERDNSGYRTGVSLIFGANAYLTTSPLVAAARPVLQELASRTGLTTSLFVRSGWNRVVVARVHGSRPIGYELPIGAKLPLYLGSGKVLISELDDDEFTAFIESIGPMTDAERQTVSSESLRNTLKQIEEDGYHVSYGERQVGALSVSAPVRSSQTGRIVGAATIGAAQKEVPDDEMDSLVVEVRRAASAVIAA